MGTNGRSKNEPIMMTPRPVLTNYVCYVVCTVSIKCKADTQATAAKFAGEEVRRLLASQDRMVYIPKVAVFSAGDDEGTKKDIEEGRAPWLVDSDPKTPPDGHQYRLPFEETSTVDGQDGNSQGNG